MFPKFYYHNSGWSYTMKMTKCSVLTKETEEVPPRQSAGPVNFQLISSQIRISQIKPELMRFRVASRGCCQDEFEQMQEERKRGGQTRG